MLLRYSFCDGNTAILWLPSFFGVLLRVLVLSNDLLPSLADPKAPTPPEQPTTNTLCAGLEMIGGLLQQ